MKMIGIGAPIGTSKTFSCRMVRRQIDCPLSFQTYQQIFNVGVTASQAVCRTWQLFFMT